MSERRPAIAMLVPGGLEHAGGIGRWAGYLLDAWRADPARPPIVIIDTRGHGGKLVGILAFPRALLQLAGLMLSGRLALLHVNLASRGSTVRKCVVVYAAALFGVPVVLHLHGGYFNRFYASLAAPFQALIRGMFRRAKSVLVLGEVWRRFIIDEIGADPAKVEILFNGVPRPSEPARPMTADRTCHIVMLGRLEPLKGVPELIEALSSPALRALAWRATLAGDGDVAGTRRRIEELGLADRIALPGWIAAERAAALLADADMLVLVSHVENMPMAVLEALAHRVAVIATPVGTTPEILEDGVSALLVPVGDAAALGTALGRLIADSGLRARIAAAGHGVFRAQLDIALAADRLAQLYRNCAPRLAPPISERSSI